MEVMMCKLTSMATTIGTILVGIVVSVAMVYFLFATAGSFKK